MSSKRSAFVVEHDFIMATYLADQVICFDGIPAKDAFCSCPESLITGMNKFLRLMEITFRRDPNNWRPRINKYKSLKDQEQKAAGNYFLMDSAKVSKEDEDEDEKYDKIKSNAGSGDGGKGGKAKGGKKGKKKE